MLHDERFVDVSPEETWAKLGGLKHRERYAAAELCST